MPPPDPLEQLRVLDISSADFPNQIAKLLCSNEYKQCVQGLEGDILVWLVEFLHDVRLCVLHNPPLLNITQVMNKFDPTHPVFSSCFVELRGICRTREVLPKICTISGARLSTDDVPFASGGLTNMHEGSLGGSKVCVEKVRMYLEGDPRKAKVYISLRPFSSSRFLGVLNPTSYRCFTWQPSRGST